MASKRFLRRMIAIAMLLVMAPVLYVSAECAGWSRSVAERMACCQREGGATTEALANSCCADGEQRQNLQAVAVVLVSPGPMVSRPLSIGLATRWHQLVPHSHSLFEGPRTHLLDSVFLI